HEEECYLGHWSQVAAGANRSFLACIRCDTLVKHLHVSLSDLKTAARVAVGVHVYTTEHCTAANLNRSRVTNAGSMVIYEIVLEVFDVVIIENSLGKLAAARGNPVQALMCHDLFLERGAAVENLLAGSGVKLRVFSVACNIDNGIDG